MKRKQEGVNAHNFKSCSIYPNSNDNGYHVSNDQLLSPSPSLPPPPPELPSPKPPSPPSPPELPSETAENRVRVGPGSKGFNVFIPWAEEKELGGEKRVDKHCACRGLCWIRVSWVVKCKEGIRGKPSKRNVSRDLGVRMTAFDAMISLYDALRLPYPFQ